MHHFFELTFFAPLFFDNTYFEIYQRIFLLEIWSPEMSLSQKSASYYEFGENSKTVMFFQLFNRPVFAKFDAMILICGESSRKMPMILIDFECLFRYGKKWKNPLFENMKIKIKSTLLRIFIILAKMNVFLFQEPIIKICSAGRCGRWGAGRLDG